MLRTSISPTIIQGGFRRNVIPARAEARLDVRAVPGEDIDAMVATLRRLIDDPAVQLVSPGGGRVGSPTSGIQTDMFRALETAQRKLFPEAATLPVLLTGATNMAPLRARGVHAYGLGPPARAGNCILGKLIYHSINYCAESGRHKKGEQYGLPTGAEPLWWAMVSPSRFAVRRASFLRGSAEARAVASRAGTRFNKLDARG